MKKTVSIFNRGKFKGYPMSTFVSQRNHVLSKEALEVACHAIENYLQRLSSGNYSNLKVPSFCLY